MNITSRKVKLIVLIFALVFAGVAVYVVVGVAMFWTPTYYEGSGDKYPITEAQVVKAEMGFDLPTSAREVRLALYGGKDYSLAGRMLVDGIRLRVVLQANGYEQYDASPFQDMTQLYPQLSWFVLPASDLHIGFRHPESGAEVLFSTRRGAAGLTEVYFQPTSLKRDPITWQYFE
ncbi:MAG: hypothetical protein ACE37H_06435 [Phycisphaeraceae bacterium]